MSSHSCARRRCESQQPGAALTRAAPPNAVRLLRLEARLAQKHIHPKPSRGSSDKSGYKNKLQTHPDHGQTGGYVFTFSGGPHVVPKSASRKSAADNQEISSEGTGKPEVLRLARKQVLCKIGEG